MSDEAKLKVLDAFMIEQILNASDAEILADAKPNDAELVQRAFERAKIQAQVSSPDFQLYHVEKRR